MICRCSRRSAFQISSPQNAFGCWESTSIDVIDEINPDGCYADNNDVAQGLERLARDAVFLKAEFNHDLTETIHILC